VQPTAAARPASLHGICAIAPSDGYDLEATAPHRQGDA
jgi:hypothetical protein